MIVITIRFFSVTVSNSYVGGKSEMWKRGYKKNAKIHLYSSKPLCGDKAAALLTNNQTITLGVYDNLVNDFLFH